MTEEINNRKQRKKKYESPLLLELGSLARGVGGSTCTTGSNPSGTPCEVGISAQALCGVGTGVI